MSRPPRRPARLLWASLLLVVALSPLYAGDGAPLLWKLESPGGTKASYLFGTIHLCDPAVATPPDALGTALASVDGVFTEIPMDAATEAAAGQAMLLPKRGSLKAILPADLIGRADAEIRRINPNLNFDLFDRLKIWALAVTLVPLEAQVRFPDQLPLDRVIYDRAVTTGKKVGGIETLDEQVGVFEAFDRKEQTRLLRMTLDQREEFRKKGIDPSEELKAAYLAGDLDALAKKLDEWLSDGDSPLALKARKLLFTDRNLRMAERIARHLKEEPGTPMLFAVGAGHLPGDDGIIDLLRRRGFKLSRVGAPAITPKSN